MQVFTNIPKYSELSGLYPEFKAILWDMDGTIMNTEPLHALAILRVIEKYHGEVTFSETDLEHNYRGKTDTEVLMAIHARGYLNQLTPDQFIEEKDKFFLDLLPQAEPGTILNEGIKQLIQELASNNIIQAVVTSSEKLLTHHLLKHLDIFDHFQMITTREDTLENKPSPLPYQHTMGLLKYEPNNIIIFEDSEVGIQAASGVTPHIGVAKWY